jgi:hypothetical protein
LEPHLPPASTFLEGDDFEKKKIIFKIFNLYIPMCKIIVVNTHKSKYENLAIYKKIHQVIFSEKVIASI